jgi:DNA repair protein RadA/Sms
MGKTKVLYICQQCGAQSARWAGRCAECGEWNSIVEEQVSDEGAHVRPSFVEGAHPVPLIVSSEGLPERLSTGDEECDRVLGGGIVPGSLTLVGGDPGIGKSTLMLQISRRIAQSTGKVLYVSGEESFDQMRLRARRLGALDENVLLLTETAIDVIRKYIVSNEYALVVIDSIQSVYSSTTPSTPGSAVQVRECANEFLRIAKGHGVPVFLVGHVTKDGMIAGPRLLEHLVDTTLYFEGEGRQALRLLRAVKNRFGSTNEVAVFEMTQAGLVDVPNPRALFLGERPKGVSGSVVIPSMEGTRPLLVEVQALVCSTPLASPRRTVTGLNPNRVSLLLAVLEKRAGLHFSDKDVFANVVGGVRLEEPAADLATALALASSLREAPVPANLVAFGEMGLAGEVRAVDMPRQRVAEASKFGFARCIIPKSCAADVEDHDVEILPVSGIVQAIEIALER